MHRVAHLIVKMAGKQRKEMEQEREKKTNKGEITNLLTFRKNQAYA